MSVRLAVPTGDLARSATKHIKQLQSSGQRVVFVSLNQGAAALEDLFSAAGVDVEAMHVVDAITPREEAPPTGPMPTTYIGSPAMLELMWMRVEKIAQRTPDSHIVFCCLNTLIMYNGQQAGDQFLHYASERLAQFDIPMDVLVQDGPEARDIEARARPFALQRLELAKA